MQVTREVFLKEIHKKWSPTLAIWVTTQVKIMDVKFKDPLIHSDLKIKFL